MRDTLRNTFVDLLGRTRAGQWLQARRELAYWKKRHTVEEGAFARGHYEAFFTAHFELPREHYTNARVLDIGCGPRGSLEWATHARERVGLDPLANDYLAMGADRHAMRYLAGTAESIPFPTGHFDVVSSFNSLLCVRDMETSVREIARVIREGGALLLVTRVNHPHAANVPQVYGWEITERFAKWFSASNVRRVEFVGGGAFQSLEANEPFDDAKGVRREGVLAVKLTRNAERVSE